MSKPSARWLWPALGTIVLGCSPTPRPDPGRLSLTSLKDPSAPTRYHQSIARGSYRRRPGRRCDIVLRSSGDALADAAAERIDHVLHIDVFYRPVPGKTYVERTMTNARLDYYVLAGAQGLHYTGAGFVTFDLAGDGEMTGRIESGHLDVAQRINGAVDRYGAMTIQGRFRAARDPAGTLDALRRLGGRFDGRPD